MNGTKSKPRVITVLLLFVALSFSHACAGAIFTLLHRFNGADGAEPFAGLIRGTNGSFYGSTSSGGTVGTNGGYGTVFQITADGDFTSLYSFDYTNGAYPDGALCQGADGNFYGTAYGGGANENGVVFRIDAAGNYTNLHSFNGFDGSSPEDTLVQGSDGRLYGTTPFGGNDGYANGTVFSIDLAGDFETVAAFVNPNVGSIPMTGLTAAPGGEFFGVTEFGGVYGQGDIFKMTTNGILTNLVSFPLYDRIAPYARLCLASDGYFYGLRDMDVFKMAADGTISKSFPFPNFLARGSAFVNRGLIQGSDGQLYGTMASAGPYADGVIFSVTTNGLFTLLHIFNGYDGFAEESPLIQGSDASFYGVARSDGVNNSGVIFKITITPDFLSASLQNGAIALTWEVEPGQTYQLQTATNLASANWSNFGNPTLAASPAITVSDSLTNAQRFYRVEIVPP